MNTVKNILQEITRLTNTMETNYPELYRTPYGNPMTIPATNHLHTDKEIMEDYLDSLKQILMTYLRTKKK